MPGRKGIGKRAAGLPCSISPPCSNYRAGFCRELKVVFRSSRPTVVGAFIPREGALPLLLQDFRVVEPGARLLQPPLKQSHLALGN